MSWISKSLLERDMIERLRAVCGHGRVVKSKLRRAVCCVLCVLLSKTVLCGLCLVHLCSDDGRLSKHELFENFCDVLRKKHDLVKTHWMESN